MSANDSKMSVIRVFSYEPGTKVSKQKRTIEFPVSEKDDRKLEIIRKLLVQHKVLGALDVRNPFCDASGAEVSDQMSIGVYLGQLVETDEEDVEVGVKVDAKPDAEEDANKDVNGDAKKDDKTNDKADTQPVVPAKLKAQVLPKFYYKKKKVQTKTDDATQEFLKKKLDLKLRNNPALSPMRAQLLQSAFKGDQWTAAPAAKLSVVAELNERDWSVIARTNCLLSGQRLTFGKDLKNPAVERTPFNAFKIKSRKFDSYEVVAPAAPKKGVSKGAEIEELLAHIPRFRVDDSSYVSVIETQNSLQSSMAKSSFSQSSIEASAGGGFWGVSAAVKGGFSTKEGQNEVSANAEEQKQMHVVYSFPRVTVYLDADSLELTEEVKRDIAEVQRKKTKESVKDFGDKYGHIFSRRVKLGGRLMSSHQSTATTSEEQADSENSLKAAAAVSISGWGFSAAAEASHEEVKQSTNSENKQNFASNMSWEATGGNTVLCNDPPSWCGTVGNFRHWRIVEQSDIIPLTKLISTFSGFENTETNFHKIAGTDVLPEGRHVRYKIQLIDIATGKRLIALPKGGANPLKTALGKISAMGGFGPLARNSLEKTIADVEAGNVHFDLAGNQKNASYWVLERWVRKGQKPELSYGVRTFISNPAMPEANKYLGLTKPIPHTPDSGFLYSAGESNRNLFILEKPARNSYQDVIKSGDIVILRIRNSSDTAERGYVMKGGFYGKDDSISKDINQVPAFGQKITYHRTDNTEKILKFRVEIENFWMMP